MVSLLRRDKIHYPTSIAFEQQYDDEYSGDWTRSILNYKERYHIDEKISLFTRHRIIKRLFKQKMYEVESEYY